MNQKKILIVDDTLFVWDAVKQSLSGECLFFTAGRGDDGLVSFLKHEPDAVILDVELEGSLQGPDLLKLIKKAYPDKLVVMMSASTRFKTELLGLGADRFFEKPFDAFELRDFFISKGFPLKKDLGTEKSSRPFLKKLMIIDDQPEIRRCLIEAFHDDYDVAAPTSEEEVMPCFRREKPLFVILDYELWNDHQCDQILRAMKAENPKIFVIIHTSSSERGLKDRLVSEGADCFVEKSVNSLLELFSILEERAQKTV